MAIVGNMIAEASGGNPSIVNYAMFVAVFAMLSLFWLFPATFVESLAFHPLLMVAVDLLNTLFWFCGAIAFAAYLGAHSCDNGVSILNCCCLPRRVHHGLTHVTRTTPARMSSRPVPTQATKPSDAAKVKPVPPSSGSVSLPSQSQRFFQASKVVVALPWVVVAAAVVVVAEVVRPCPKFNGFRMPDTRNNKPTRAG